MISGISKKPRLDNDHRGAMCFSWQEAVKARFFKHVYTWLAPGGLLDASFTCTSPVQEYAMPGCAKVFSVSGVLAPGRAHGEMHPRVLAKLRSPPCRPFVRYRSVLPVPGSRFCLSHRSCRVRRLCHPCRAGWLRGRVNRAGTQ